MIVVSDTSPLSNLFIIGQLGLLEELYGRIIVPEAVMNELLILENFNFDLSAIKDAPWIEVVEVEQKDALRKLVKDIDLGEAEAILLAESLNAEWLLIDEKKGRSIARLHGLQIVGLLGILLLAKEKGLVPSIRVLLDDLISKAKFRVSDDLYNKVISTAGE